MSEGGLKTLALSVDNRENFREPPRLTVNIKPKLKSRISSVVLAFYIALSALGLNAEPIPSPPQVREWKETYPGGIINYSDKSVDYSRDGKVVFRTIERTSTVSRTGHSSILIDHLIEFAAEGKTFASIVLV